jgi:hypothetical protein
MASVKTMQDVMGLLEESGGKPPGFVVRPWYERHTDSLICYFEDTPSYGNRLNQLFTLFLSADDHRLVGIEVKGFVRLMKRMKDGGIEIEATNKTVRLKKLAELAFVMEPERPDLMRHFGTIEIPDFDVEIPDEACAIA